MFIKTYPKILALHMCIYIYIRVYSYGCVCVCVNIYTFCTCFVRDVCYWCFLVFDALFHDFIIVGVSWQHVSFVLNMSTSIRTWMLCFMIGVDMFNTKDTCCHDKPLSI